ncbi:protoporphyrinogen oxidase HemJ [Martelella soudanensis]|uniref:protoporphyrinogen oxidase HemJ n=1 Tax=unclassified Martelella TaxID=2629616 RepID=UPI0015DE6A48|nr:MULTISPECIES: protoporphyrinogen oxidase HemJ [unclassified Martelella]
MADRDNAGSKAAGRAMTALLVFLALCLAIYIFDRDNFYLWAKAIHIMAVIAWMAGMFYLPRLFVYHAETKPGSDSSETFKVMEYRLMKAIMNPAMILTWIFGLYLAWEGFRFSGGWLHVKILAVFVMSGVHGYLSKAIKEFAADKRVHSAKHWRIVNEAPTLLMIIIVIMVVLKPF